jgi:perosamine synthetase
MQRDEPGGAPGKKPFIPNSRPSLGALEKTYVLQALESTWVSSTGEFVTRFEQDVASFLGVGHGVATSNGTTALHLACAALDLGPGDEVLAPDLTFAATANAVFMTGATPVLVDSCPHHWNMDPAAARQALTPRTKGMIVVHLLGHPCDMAPLMAMAEERGLWVVEDCAEALGVTYGGRKVGGFGRIGAFSFYANKVITTGEGGLCATDDPALAERMRTLRAHGMSGNRQYWHEAPGFNYRITNLNAALGVAQMERLGELLAARRRLAELYHQGLAGLPGLIFNLPALGDTIDWLFPLFVDEAKLGLSRDRVRQGMQDAGIDARPMFYPMHMMPPFAGLPRSGPLENSKRWGLTGLLLPLFPELTPEQVAFICRTLADIIRGR